MYVKFVRVRKIFRTQAFAGFAVFLHLKLLFRKCVTYVLGCSFIKTCSLTGVCVPRPSALGPWPPSRWPSASNILQEQIYE